MNTSCAILFLLKTKFGNFLTNIYNYIMNNYVSLLYFWWNFWQSLNFIDNWRLFSTLETALYSQESTLPLQLLDSATKKRVIESYHSLGLSMCSRLSRFLVKYIISNNWKFDIQFFFAPKFIEKSKDMSAICISPENLGNSEKKLFS